jgi:hypothetical protein
MPLITDSFAAAGTLLVTVGSGLQSYSELRSYSKLAETMGVTEAAGALKGLTSATMAFYRPGIWRIPRRIRHWLAASTRYFYAVLTVFRITLSKEEKNQAWSLALKAVYWALIMSGSFTVFIGSCIGIGLDLTASG